MNKHFSALLLFIALICFFSVDVFAQRKSKMDTTKSAFLIQPDRIEFEIDNRDGDFQIIPAEENGLLVIKETRNKSRNGFEWNFNLVDSALNIQ